MKWIGILLLISQKFFHLTLGICLSVFLSCLFFSAMNLQEYDAANPLVTVSSQGGFP